MIESAKNRIIGPMADGSYEVEVRTANGEILAIPVPAVGKMDLETQKFMALEGVHIWARAVLTQVQRIEAARGSMNPKLYPGLGTWPEPVRTFLSERHLFLIAANKLVECIDWVLQLNFLDKTIFDEVLALREDIELMRNLNEHQIEYFLGEGRFPDKWRHVDEESIADASSTVGSKIGNRLDWNELAVAAQHLIGKLPSAHLPKRDR